MAYELKIASKTYTCRLFNIGELEAFGEKIPALPLHRVPWLLIYTVLTQAAEPKLTDAEVKAIEAKQSEVTAAFQKILEENGMVAPGQPLPKPTEAAGSGAVGEAPPPTVN